MYFGCVSKGDVASISMVSFGEMDNGLVFDSSKLLNSFWKLVSECLFFEYLGTPAEIRAFVDKYNAKFQFFEKIKVNGSDAHPLYQFLKSQKSGGLGISTIKWNFAKFLVDVEGNVVHR